MPGNNSRKNVHYLKYKHGETRQISRKHHDDDDDIKSQGDYSVAKIAPYRNETYKLPKEPRLFEDDDRLPSPPPDPHPPRREGSLHHDPNPYRLPERQPLVQNLAPAPYMPIYEQCVVLRRHGISVRLGPDGFRAISQQGPPGPPPVSCNHNCGAHSISPNVHNPSVPEQQAITEAIVYIVGKCGGEVDIPGFEPQPTIQCSPCAKPIPSPMPSPVSPRKEMDEYSNGNRNAFQNGHGSHAATYEHSNQCTIPIALDTLEGRQPGVNWAGHGR